MKKKICFVSTFFGTAEKFLHEHIMKLSEEYDITLVCDYQEKDYEVLTDLPVKYKKITIERKMSVLTDFKSIWQLYIFFRKEKFWAIHALSHKPGLLVPIAAIMAGCKHRVYTFTGQYWASKTGLKRWVLKEIDFLIALLHNHVMIDGFSQRQFLLDEHVISEDKSIVLGNGSICGVNLSKFDPQVSVREAMRKECRIGGGKVVFTYLGRLCKDKGITELIEAFNKLVVDCPNAFLAFVGWDEDGYLQKIQSYQNIKEGENFLFYGATTEPEKTYQISDVACIPSYREGFGMCVIEASALGIPVICSDVYGILDSYIDGVTGLKCKAKDVNSLYDCMKTLYDNSAMRHELGRGGRKFIEDNYSSAYVTQCWFDYYKSISD